VLADETARYFMVRPPANSMRINDCLAAVRQRFVTLYGESPDNWEFSAHWDARRDFLACAIPKILHGGLLQVARDCELAVSSIVPQFVAAANQWRRHLDADSWLAVSHRRHLTIGIARAGRWLAVRTQGTHCLGGDWLARCVAREALLHDMAPPQQLAVCGSSPEHYVLNTEDGFSCVRFLASPLQDPALASDGAVLALSGSGQGKSRL
jgi:hypothetical protein